MRNGLRMVLPVVFAVRAVAPSQVSAQDVLEEVRKLYGAAFYERALATLDEISNGPEVTPADEQSVRRYKALCLIALDRNDEALRVTDEIVRAEPMADMDPGDPPRLRELIGETRARLLPDLVRERYARGRAHFEQKAFADAAADMEAVLALLSDSTADLSALPELADMGLLARGFLDVVHIAASQAAAASPQQAVRPNQGLAPAQDSALTVVPPVAINQQPPPWPAALRALLKQSLEGAIEVVVGVDGSVESATIVTPIHVGYDWRLLAAARSWRYHPALRNGIPIPATKRIRVVIDAGS